jgi:hypothetical protein
VDPYTLQTLGLETLGGRVRPGLPFKVGVAVAGGVVAAVQRLLGSNHLLPPGKASDWPACLSVYLVNLLTSMLSVTFWVVATSRECPSDYCATQSFRSL